MTVDVLVGIGMVLLGDALGEVARWIRRERQDARIEQLLLAQSRLQRLIATQRRQAAEAMFQAVRGRRLP